MKFAGARGITRTRVPLIAMLALAATIGLAGCEGDDGKDGLAGTPGTPGTPGATGPIGPTGPTGPVGPSATIEPRESCGVCHANGSAYGVDAMHAVLPDVAVSNVTIAASTTNAADLVVTFNVKAGGSNFTTLTALSRGYQFNGTLRNTLGTIDSTVPGDVVTTPTLSGGTGGNYTITIAGGNTQYGAIPSRYMFRLETAAGSSGTRAIVTGDYPSSPDQQLVSSAGCSDCHGANGSGYHYGYPASGATCTVCHNATNTNYPRLVNIGHGIHNAHGMPSGEFVLETVNGDDSWTYHTTYPTYMTNCSVCHTASSGAQAKVNAMPVTGEGCFTCHGSMESWDFAASGTTFHESMTAATNCQTCHVAGGIAPATVAAFHNGIETERVGIIWNGEDLSVTEGKKFTWTITNVVDDGTNLKISWSATYNGAAVDPCNSAIGPGKPLFHNAPTGTVLDGAPQFLRTYAQGDDFILGKSTTAPGQPGTLTLNNTNTVCAANVATTTWAVDKDVTAGSRGYLALQGKPQLPLPAGFDNAHYEYTNMYVRVPTPDREWVVGTGALPAQQRRAVADTGDCLKCHVGSLYQHGNTRVDNVKMCGACHNSASSEQNVRVGMGVDRSESYDGLPGQTYEFKTMLHAIHSAGEEGSSPIVIYRTRGIFAWATDESLLRNWPGASSTPIPVFGSDPASPTRLQVHNFHTPTYPRETNDCAACHVANFGVIPDQSKAVATTLDAGVAPWQNKLDDTLQGASAAACTSCHSSTDARGHAYQNGWTPQVFPNGRQTILDTK